MLRCVALAMVVSMIACGEGGLNNSEFTLTLTRRASVTQAKVEADLGSESPSVSGDGRKVVFASKAKNLSADDSDDLRDVYLKDMETGAVTLLSRAGGVSGAKGNADSDNPVISADGRFVAFESFASNLDPLSDADGYSDIYLRNLDTNETKLVSRADGASGAKGSRSSAPTYSCAFPSISADGAYVAFQTNADNFGGDSDTLDDIYVRNWAAGETKLVSRASGATGSKGSGGSSQRPAISADGAYVAFQSDATNLVTSSDFGGADTNGQTDVFIRDWRATSPITERVSLTAGSVQIPSGGGASFPSVSQDGRYVAFHSASALVVLGDNNTTTDVFLRDRTINTTTRVSLNGTGAEGNGASSNPSLSGDGRFLLFDSTASNMVSDDTNGVRDVFLRDLQAGATYRVSVQTYGEQANPPSSSATGSQFPKISKDGKFAVFESDLIDLVTDDRNGVVDIFLRGPLLY